MTTTTVTKGRWYPSPAPALDGEDSDTYSDRLIGVHGEDQRPYDHPRNRQCSIGWHTECSERRSLVPKNCRCPCHQDVLTTSTALPAPDALPGPVREAASRLAGLYGLPAVTAHKVMLIASRLGGTPDEGLLRERIAEVYGPQEGQEAAWFVTDVAKVYAAAVAGTL